MKNYFDEIEAKLKEQIEIEELLIVDNSHKHKGHKFFSSEKFHLHLKIKSLYLNSISRVSAQKSIMRILKEDLKKKIHAIEISIER
ncbi:BolA/IbaG family iron-sulfur metabolism protein [Pelagibacteraceae bacterium]|jgi:BolA family transcriptional regulator, general stress-responsive regulator|nr:BolA/IbaG family iron-sulfur metabolism protein [Pelagibacteraceae bacterium]